MRVPMSLLAKPTGAACNLDCSYCFFLSKDLLWDAGKQAMSHEVLDAFVRNYLDSQPDGVVTLAWQGGEPTLRGLDFFKEAVALAESYRRPRQTVEHSIQTNGTLLDDAWGAFLAEQKFLVGISFDGPPRLHDAYRVNKAGRGSYELVRRGWDVLTRHQVERNVLCTVNAANAAHPLEVYRHFRDDLGAQFLQFIPVVERVATPQLPEAEAGWVDAEGRRLLYSQTGDAATSRSVPAEQWGIFLSTIFDEWVGRDVGEVFVQHFDTALAALFGRYSLCVHAPQCGTALTVEHHGDVYSCDHYVEPGYKLGNLLSDSLTDMVTSPFQRDFGRTKADLPRQCRECDVRWACHGGCPKDRFAMTADGEPGLNVLCEGYRRFFRHATPDLRRMAALVAAGRPAAEVMLSGRPS